VTEVGLLEDLFHVFVLKLWCDQRDTEAGACVWRGSIENAVTRRVVYFNDLTELTSFLQGSMLGQAPESEPRAALSEHGRRSVL
jgi:hypothetical protein